MLFWWSMIKLKRKKYKLMKEIYKLQQEYLKWNSTNDGKGNERTRVKHSIEKIYEEIDCVEREIYELETERFLNQGMYLYCRCGNDLNNGLSTSANKKDGSVIYSCNKCGNVSSWRFDIAPVPVCMEDISKTMEEYTLNKKREEMNPTFINKHLDEYKKKEENNKEEDSSTINIDKQLEDYKLSLEDDIYTQLKMSDDIRDKYDDI